jgi:hypothetical protein
MELCRPQAPVGMPKLREKRGYGWAGGPLKRNRTRQRLMDIRVENGLFHRESRIFGARRQRAW